MKNFIVKINYNSHFNPIFYKKFNNIKNKNKIKINCRNLILFLFLIKYSNNFFKNSKVTVFIKPKKKYYINILKAPYKNKLSKNQIGFLKYFILFKFYINLKYSKMFFFNEIQFFKFFNNFIIFFNFFETNILKNNKIIFYFKFVYKNFFFLK